MDSKVLDCISKKWVRDNIANSFSGMFLTLLSIVQGVALGVWATQWIPKTEADWQQVLSLDLLLILTTFLLLVTIWHSYFWLAAIAYWVPSIVDSLLMFLIGATQLVVIYNMKTGSPYWFYGIAVLGLLGGVQYHYNALMLPAHVWCTETSELGDHIRAYKKKRGKKLIGSSVVLFLATLALHIRWPNRVWWLVFLVLGVQLWSLWRHLHDRTKTLNYLG